VAIETAPRLLERERELGGLDDALSAARAGSGRIVLIEAAAGLGKTSLLAAAFEARRSASRSSPAGSACASMASREPTPPGT
jgi:ATP/maltotriose-dependent transcriptional regulator MalT